MEQYRAANPNYVKNEIKSDKKRRHKLKFEVLLHYTQIFNLSATEPHCKCGFSDIRALTLDRIEGGHKKATDLYGTALYEYLKKKGYPEGWQTSCMNCQWVKRYENKEITL